VHADSTKNKQQRIIGERERKEGTEKKGRKPQTKSVGTGGGLRSVPNRYWGEKWEKTARKRQGKEGGGGGARGQMHRLIRGVTLKKKNDTVRFGRGGGNSQVFFPRNLTRKAKGGNNSLIGANEDTHDQMGG